MQITIERNRVSHRLSPDRSNRLLEILQPKPETSMAPTIMPAVAHARATETKLLAPSSSEPRNDWGVSLVSGLRKDMISVRIIDHITAICTLNPLPIRTSSTMRGISMCPPLLRTFQKSGSFDSGIGLIPLFRD